MEDKGGPGFFATALIGAAIAVVVYGAAVLILSLESKAAPQAGPGTPFSPPVRPVVPAPTQEAQ